MSNIIAIANQKGGVGKTITCANLGIGLAQEGKKVLLIDSDPQGSLTISLGYDRPDQLPVTLSDIMEKVMDEQPLAPGEGLLHHAEGVDLMPANISLSGMEVSLVNAMSREKILKQYLDTVKRQYDYVLIDCMPSLGMLTINALVAADSVLIPVQAQYLPAKGMEQLLQTINRVKRQINPKLKIDGILLTMVDTRTTYAKEIGALLRETYGTNIKTVYNGYNAQEIKDLLRAYKALDDVPTAKATKPISELVTLYSNIEEQIKVYENAVSDNKRIMQENQNRQLMLTELAELSKATPELQYLVHPIVELLEELDKSVSFSQYLISDNTIRELRKQKALIKSDIERQSDRFQRYSIDQKTKSIAVIEEYLGMDDANGDSELIEKTKEAREIKKKLDVLQGLNDEKKVAAISETITTLYKSTASVSEVVHKDIEQKGFHIDYIKRGNMLKPVVDAANGSIHYYTGSMARHTLIQFCGYLGFLELLIREGRYPLVPILVVDHISKPFDSKNRKTIGAALDAAYKMIGKENLQVFIFDDKTCGSIGINPEHKENLATKTKTGFSPFFRQ